MQRVFNLVQQTFDDRKGIYISIWIDIKVGCEVQEIVGCPILVNFHTTLAHYMTTLHQSMHGDSCSVSAGVVSWVFDKVHASTSFRCAQRCELINVCRRLVARTELFRKGEYLNYCTKSINLSVTCHIQFLWTLPIIFSQFMAILEIYWKFWKVTCCMNWLI